MALTSEMIRQIRVEVEKQANTILSGSAGTNTMDTETINDLFPGSPGIQDRPIMHPYGFASRAPQGTISVVGRQGSHIGNRITLGHRDAKKPSVEVGETAVYNLSGYTVMLSKGAVKVGKSGTYETLVVGDTLSTLLGALLDALVAHTHTTTGPGSPTSPPNQAADFTKLKSDYISNSKILAKDGGRF